MSIPTDPPPSGPYFKGGFFWYVTLQVALATAFAAGTFGYFFLSAVLFPENAAALAGQAATWEKIAQPLVTVLTIALCINVANRHNTGFGRGILLFFAGNFVSAVICVPLLIVIMMGDADSGLAWLASLVLIILAYAIGCIVAIVWRRRKEAASRLQARDIATFD